MGHELPILKSETVPDLICVNRETLAAVLEIVDKQGFLIRQLGLTWSDDGSGYARQLVVAALEDSNANSKG